MSDAVMVPREPTEAMLRKAIALTSASVSRHDIKACWSAMLAASPALAASTPVGGSTPGGWLVKDFADGWYWTCDRLNADMAANGGACVFSIETGQYETDPPPSVSIDNGSRPQEAVPGEGHDAAVIDRIHWLCEGAQPSDYAVVLTAIREAVAPVDNMVQRFLSWRLPEDFNPDNGISFKPTFNDHMDPPMRCNPTGTNLFDARQAEAMVRHMLSGEAS